MRISTIFDFALAEFTDSSLSAIVSKLTNTERNSQTRNEHNTSSAARRNVFAIAFSWTKIATETIRSEGLVLTWSQQARKTGKPRHVLHEWICRSYVLDLRLRLRCYEYTQTLFNWQGFVCCWSDVRAAGLYFLDFYLAVSESAQHNRNLKTHNQVTRFSGRPALSMK